MSQVVACSVYPLSSFLAKTFFVQEIVHMAISGEENRPRGAKLGRRPEHAECQILDPSLRPISCAISPKLEVGPDNRRCVERVFLQKVTFPPQLETCQPGSNQESKTSAGCSRPTACRSPIPWTVVMPANPERVPDHIKCMAPCGDCRSGAGSPPSSDLFGRHATSIYVTKLRRQ